MAATPPTDIRVRVPSKYQEAITSQQPNSESTSTSAPPSAAAFSPPPLEWLHRTWSVTHSTLKMWRSAQNVRITYSPLSPSADGRPRIDDLVEHEKPGKKGVKTVTGIDTASSSSAGPDSTSAWDWKGKGWLFFVHSHWEILGWGERPLAGHENEEQQVERWVVTWFAKTPFSQEGVDFYSDRREGLSSETVEAIRAEMEKGPEGLKALVAGEKTFPVTINLPWQEKSGNSMVKRT